MKKIVWILNHYAGTMFEDKGGRHYSFAKYLKKAGYEPIVFCSNAKHNSNAELFFERNQLWEVHNAEEIGVPFVFIKSRPYVGNGKERIFDMVDFYKNVKKCAKEYVKSNAKPDVILASSVHPLTLVAGIKLAKYFGVKCICEVRDLWPESFIAYGIVGKKNPIVFALRKLEKWIYINANTLIFTMEGGYDYIVEQKWELDIPRSKVYYLNNGVDLEDFQYYINNTHLDDVDLNNKSFFKIIYAGSVRKANGIDNIISVANVVKKRNEHGIKFLIYGDGPDREILEERARSENVSNIIFKGKVDKKYIPYILSMGDLNLLNYASETTNVYRFGSSQNKLFEYLASGIPVLSNVKINYSLLDKFSCGIELADENVEAYADEIINLYRDKTKYRTLAKNCEKAVSEYDYKKLSEQLLRIIKLNIDTAKDVLRGK